MDEKSKKETGILTTTEVANANHVDLALKNGIDILWIELELLLAPSLFKKSLKLFRD